MSIKFNSANMMQGGVIKNKVIIIICDLFNQQATIHKISDRHYTQKRETKLLLLIIILLIKTIIVIV